MGKLPPERPPAKAPAGPPVPQVLGVSLFIPSVLCLASGVFRNELALILVGAIPLGAALYCFCCILIFSLIFRKKISSFDARIIPESIEAEKANALRVSCDMPGKFFILPCILLRYELELRSRDGKIFRHSFDPRYPDNFRELLPLPSRGAYYGETDRVAIFDIFGLFRLTRPVVREPGCRLLVTPKMDKEPLSFEAHAGGDEQRRNAHFLRTDNLIDHRPYIPGDDPRRINWKLYGHLGDLFVREGEREPPPHGKLLILVDSQADPALYKGRAAQAGVDLLCENALALGVEYAGRGMEVTLGYTGFSRETALHGKVFPESGLNPEEMADFLAFPWALPLDGPENLNALPENRGILILALPRTEGLTTSLDRFLKTLGEQQRADIIFLYREFPEDALAPSKFSLRLKRGKRAVNEDSLEVCAGICRRIYNRQGGVYARSLRL